MITQRGIATKALQDNDLQQGPDFQGPTLGPELASDADFLALGQVWPGLSPAGRRAVRQTAEALAEAGGMVGAE